MNSGLISIDNEQRGIHHDVFPFVISCRQNCQNSMQVEALFLQQPVFQLLKHRGVKLEVGSDAPAMSATWIDMQRCRNVVPVEFQVIVDAI